MSSKGRKLTAEEKIDQAWEILKDRDNKLIQEYMRIMRNTNEREQRTKERNVNPVRGRWQGRTVYDSDGRATGKIGFSSRKMNLKPNV